MNKKMTDFARGLKWGGRGAIGFVATGLAAACSCASIDANAMLPTPTPHRSKNWRRVVWRSSDLSFLFDPVKYAIMRDYSSVFNAHPSFIDDMYKRYTADPSSVDDGWQAFFRGFDFGGTTSNGQNTGTAHQMDVKEFGVMAIIEGFRDRGHLLSTTNPIRQRRDRKPHLDLSDYGLEQADLSMSFRAGMKIGMGEEASLRQILDQGQA